MSKQGQVSSRKRSGYKQARTKVPTWKDGQTSQLDREKFSSLVGGLMRQLQSLHWYAKRGKFVREERIADLEERLGEVKSCFFNTEKKTGDSSTSLTTQRTLSSSTSSLEQPQKEDIKPKIIKPNVSREVATEAKTTSDASTQDPANERPIYTRRLLLGKRITDAEYDSYSKKKQTRIDNAKKARVVAGKYFGYTQIPKVLKVVTSPLTATCDLATKLVMEASNRPVPPPRKKTYRDAVVGETTRMAPNHVHEQVVNEADPLLTKPVLNTTETVQYKQRIPWDRQRLRRTPLYACEDLVYFLCKEFAGKVRDKGVMSRMFQKANNEMSKYDCSSLTIKEQYQYLVRAVTQAMVPPIEEANMRQHLKAIDNDELFTKHARMCRDGNLGKVGYFTNKKLPEMK